MKDFSKLNKLLFFVLGVSGTNSQLVVDFEHGFLTVFAEVFFMKRVFKKSLAYSFIRYIWFEVQNYIFIWIAATKQLLVKLYFAGVFYKM